MYTKYIKLFFDRLTAFILLILVSPFLIIIILLLAVANKGNVWFVQARPGKNEDIFKVIKFKTMSDECDVSGLLLPDELRLTVIGKFVRKTSLDELPQLINVLKGDMSIIGPRPLLVEYLPLYSEEQRRRHDVKPGITGWAQVHGRNALAWPERFVLDVWYVDNVSFWVDIKILWLTVINVLRAEGISGENSMTMEKFRGNQI